MGSKVLSLAVKAGTTVESIDYRVFSSLPLLLPPEKEQQQIVAMLDAQDARLRAEEACCDKLKQLKKGLMHDLLTGRVRVQAEEEAR
jgi:type I restriction enzyme S subunit